MLNLLLLLVRAGGVNGECGEWGVVCADEEAVVETGDDEDTKAGTDR